VAVPVAEPAPLGLAVVGCGYWGIHHVRVAAAVRGGRLIAICDGDPAALARASRVAPSARPVAEFDQLLADPAIDAIILATPARAHAEQATRALDSGRHVLVEKPLALSVGDAERALAAAARTGRVLAVGHLMLYHPVVLRVRDLLSSGELGQLYYLYASRVNLGRLRSDENALWSFAPHDLAMIDFLLDGELPESVSARGQGYLQENVEDVVFVTLKYRQGQMAHIHLSWLDPRKERRLTLVCSRKMVEFDDVASEKLRIYDKGYDRPPSFAQYADYLTLRQGDIHIPHVPMAEPLSLEVAHFVDCIRHGVTPRTDGESGLRVIRVLAAAEESLKADGVPVRL
jgi:predicted dehydrogenase